MLNPIHRHHAAGFTLDFALMIAYTALPFYVYNELGGDERMSGTIAAGLSLAYMTVCLLLGFGVIRVTRHPLPIAGMGSLVFAIAFLFASFASHPLVFALCAMVGFSAVAFSWPAMHAWLGAEPNLHKRARLMATFNISWSIGMAVGSLLAGPIYDLHFRLPFILAAVFAGMAAMLLIKQPTEEDFFHSTPLGDGDLKNQGHASRDPHLPAAWCAVFLGFFILGAARSVFPKELADLVDDQALALLPGGQALTNSAPTLFSVLAFAITFSSAVVYFVMGRTTWWHGKFSYLIAIQCVAGAACFLLANTHSIVVMYACYTAFGVATYVAFFMGVFYSVGDPHRKKQRAAINESLVGAGGVGGAVSFGWLASFTSIATVFAWAPLIVLLAIVVQVALLRRHRESAPRRLKV